jgi:hypothetical protein
VNKMGLIEDGVAMTLSKLWGQLPADKRENIKTAALAMEEGLTQFNDDLADDNMTSEELEKDLKLIMDAMGSTAGQAFQAWIWSLFKRA